MNTQWETYGREKVDAGNRNRNRSHRKVNQPRADSEASTGKRNAGKLARSVWKGGKAERPYLSLLLEKWGRRCAYCHAKDVPLQIEHMTPRARGGSNRVSNLTLACEPCNVKKGTQTAAEFGHPEVQAQARAPLKDAAAVNASRWALWRRLAALGLPLETGTGGRTKWNRTQRDLPKANWIDAACVGASTPERLMVDGVTVLTITAQGHGTRQMAHIDGIGFLRLNKAGKQQIRSRHKRHFGFMTGDIVRAVVPPGTKASGRHTGRIAVRAGGGFRVGKVDDIRWKYCRLLQRHTATGTSVPVLSQNRTRQGVGRETAALPPHGSSRGLPRSPLVVSPSGLTTLASHLPQCVIATHVQSPTVPRGGKRHSPMAASLAHSGIVRQGEGERRRVATQEKARLSRADRMRRA